MRMPIFYKKDYSQGWFGGGTQIVFDKNYSRIYILNETHQQVIRVRDEKQIELCKCLYGHELCEEEIAHLIHRSGLQYFDNVDEYLSWLEKCENC